MHRQHGAPGHHVLETTVRLVPTNSLTEHLRQGLAGISLGGRNQAAHQGHLRDGEVTSIVPAFNVFTHGGASSRRFCDGLIVHGSQLVRSSGGFPPRCAHSVNQPMSQACTFRSLSRDRAQYCVYERLEFSPLNTVGPEADLAPNDPLFNFSLRSVVVHGNPGLIQKHAQSIAMVQQGTQRLCLTGIFWQRLQFPLRIASHRWFPRQALPPVRQGRCVNAHDRSRRLIEGFAGIVFTQIAPRQQGGVLHLLESLGQGAD